MLNYLSAELYKVRRRRGTWVFAGLLLGGEGIYLLMFTNVSFQEMLQAFVTTLVVGIPLVIQLSALVCSDMSRSGVLKNELTSGLSRSRVYLGKLLASLVVCLLMLAAVLTLCMAMGTTLFHRAVPGEEGIFLPSLFSGLAVAFPLWLGALGLAQMLFFLVPSPGTVEAIYLLWFFLFDWVPSWVSWNGNDLVARMGALLQNLLLSIPFTQLSKGDPTPELLARSWILGLGWLCVTTAVGLAVFRRRELS